MIIGRRIQKLDGNNTHAKSSRTLHIAFEGSEPMLAEFVITDKCNTDKKILAGFEPETSLTLSPPGLSTFQLWLASRYRRSAFPDSFEHRMKESGLAEKIAKAARQYGEMITAVFFDVDEGQEIPRPTPDNVYVLDMCCMRQRLISMQRRTRQIR